MNVFGCLPASSFEKNLSIGAVMEQELAKLRVESSTYLAFRSFWIIPNEFPSVSSHIAKYPMPGMAILGLTTLPPSIDIFLEKSSIEGTSIVFVTLPLVPPLY